MGRASHTIPSTHTGSLPRPDDLIQIMWAVGDGIPVDAKALDQRVCSAIDEVVRKQVEAGVTIINDGEMSKPSYATYVKDRLSGFTGESVQTYFFEDLVDFPRSAEAVAGTAAVAWLGGVLAAAGSIGCEAAADGRGVSGEDAASTSGAEAGAIAEAGEDVAVVEADVELELAARSAAPEGAG